MLTLFMMVDTEKDIIVLFGKHICLRTNLTKNRTLKVDTHDNWPMWHVSSPQPPPLPMSPTEYQTRFLTGADSVSSRSMEQLIGVQLLTPDTSDWPDPTTNIAADTFDISGISMFHRPVFAQSQIGKEQEQLIGINQTDREAECGYCDLCHFWYIGLQSALVATDPDNLRDLASHWLNPQDVMWHIRLKEYTCLGQTSLTQPLSLSTQNARSDLNPR